MREKRKITLPLLPSESIILTDQAFIKSNRRSGWKPGHLSLTNQRLVLHQPERNIFSTSLDDVSAVGTEKKGFILRSVDALTLSVHNSIGLGALKVWIMVKEPEKWQKAIFGLTRLQVSEADIERVASELDPESRAILSHIAEKRHATIQELASLYDVKNHMEVLNRIRKVINPLSEKLIGYPMLVFERSKTDAVTSEKIPFSWWVIGNAAGKTESVEPLMDLFDEEDHIVFVMELKSVHEDDIELKINGNRLQLSCQSAHKHYAEDILLPSNVDPSTVKKKYHNGILEVKLQKSLAENTH